MPIDGVLVLNEYTNSYVGVGIVLSILALAAFIAGIWALVVTIKEKETPLLWITLSMFILGIAAGAGAVDRCTTQHHYYQVMISDTVPFVEIEKNFEVHSHDGQIYTLIERTK